MSFGPIIEVGIGLIFVYLLMGLIVSALQEVVANVRKLRGKMLFEGIEALLKDGATSKLLNDVFDHALIKNTKSRSLPSYIPSRNFALALVDVLTAGAKADVLQAFRTKVEGLDEGSKLRQALDLFQREAGDDLDKLKELIATWFDDAMDRVTGAYKRWTQGFAIASGLFLAVVLNVNSIRIAAELSTNEALRANVVAAAEAYRATHPAQSSTDMPKLPDDAPKEPAPPATTTPPTTTPSTTPSTTPPTTSPPLSDGAKDHGLDDARDHLNDAVSKLTKLNLPVGWGARISGDKNPPDNAVTNTGGSANKSKWFECLVAWLSALLGWTMTGLATSLGAPFWFDMLGKVLNLRAAGPKPATTQTVKNTK